MTEMPSFRYRALRSTGSEITGELVAADERDASARLQSLGHYPIEISASTRRAVAIGVLRRHRARVPPAKLLSMTRQMAVLLGAGVDVDRALGLVAMSHRRTNASRLARDLQEAVRRGDNLAHAFSDQPLLPQHYAMIVAAGQARGDLASAFERLAELLERNQQTARMLLSALIYPASVLVVGFVSVLFLFSYVVPRFEALLTTLQHEPPLAMRALLLISAVLQSLALPSLFIAAAAATLLVFKSRDPAFRLGFYRRLLGIPGLGFLLRYIGAERVLYLLGHLLAAGVPLPSALAATGAMTTGAVRAGLSRVEQGIERGDGIAASFAAGGVLPEIAIELLRVGEEARDLAPLLLKASDLLRREIEATSTGLISLITPVSIVFLGIVIGLVATAIVGTMTDMYDLVP